MSTPTLGRIAYLSAGDVDKRWIVPEAVTSTAVALVEHWQDAERMVACWNACMGISTENLETNTPFLQAIQRWNDSYKLLHDVLEHAEMGALSPNIGASIDLIDRIRAFVRDGGA